MPGDVFVGIKYNSNDGSNLSKYGDFKCRFQSATQTMYTDALFIYTPFSSCTNPHN